jgi:hypothetical protein
VNRALFVDVDMQHHITLNLLIPSFLRVLGCDGMKQLQRLLRL